MKSYASQAGAVAFALAAVLFSPTFSAAGADEASLQTPNEDITIQARGPVHEAYAEPVEATGQPGFVVPKQPPAPVPEQPPEQRPEGDNVQWIPGYWGWDDAQRDFLWVSGCWRAVPPGRKWVPGYWTRGEDGWQWVSGFWAGSSQDQLQYQEEPPESLEYGPSAPAPEDDRVYVPGSWIYRSVRYVWRPGYWTAARPGFCWVPAHYCYTPSGYVFVDGYWDYDPADRGLLFAPVSFNRPLWTDPDWCYRPSYCVNFPALLGSLFVRPAYGHYFFGDYYGPSYARLGFTPWFTWGRRYHDPLFSYYDRANGHDPAWYRGLRSNYLGRYRGTLARPPRTLAQQNSLMQNIRSRSVVNDNGGGTNSNSVRMVQPLAQVQNNRRRLTRADNTQLARQRNLVNSYRNLSRERQRLEGAGRSLVGRSTGPSLSGIPSGRPVRGIGPSDRSRPTRSAFGSQPLNRYRQSDGIGPRTDPLNRGMGRPKYSRPPASRDWQGPANRRPDLKPPAPNRDRTFSPAAPSRSSSRYQPPIRRPASDTNRTPYQPYRGPSSTAKPPAQDRRSYEPAYAGPRTPSRGPGVNPPRANYRAAPDVRGDRRPTTRVAPRPPAHRPAASAYQPPSRPAASAYRPPSQHAPARPAPAYRPPVRTPPRAAAPSRPAYHPAPARSSPAPRPQPRHDPPPRPGQNHKK